MISKEVTAEIVSQITHILQNKGIIDHRHTVKVNIEIISNEPVIVEIGAKKKEIISLAEVAAKMKNGAIRISWGIKEQNLTLDDVKNWIEAPLAQYGKETLRELARVLIKEKIECLWAVPFLSKLSLERKKERKKDREKRDKIEAIENGVSEQINYKGWQNILKSLPPTNSGSHTSLMYRVIKNLKKSNNTPILASKVFADYDPGWWKWVASQINRRCERAELSYRIRFSRVSNVVYMNPSERFTEENNAKRLDGTYQIVTIKK